MTEPASTVPLVEPDLIEVRATVHLHGLRPGDVVRVDPNDDYVAACLRGQALVRVEPLTLAELQPSPA